MKEKLLYAILIVLICFVTISSQAQTWQWAAKAGGLENDFANSMDVDNSGNSYVTGKFYDSISFDTITLINPGTWSIFIAKYDVNGNVVWAKIVASDSAINVSGINLDKSGNISITGQYFATASFGVASVINLTSTGDYDAFVAKYDPNANLIWANSLGGPGIDYSGGISSDGINNIYLTGDFHISAFPNSGSKIFLAKYDSIGNQVWLKKSFNNGTDHFGNCIKVDSAGNSFITGEFFNTLIFDSAKIIDAGNIESNLFIAKFDSSGNILWGQKAGAWSGYCGSKVIDIDNLGNSYIAGYYHGTIVLGTFNLTSTMGLTNEILIAKCDSAGNFTWVNKSIGGGSPKSISLSNSGDIFLSGTFIQNISFGINSATTAGANDVFITKLNSLGNFDWLTSCGGSQNDYSASIKVNSNEIYIAGYFTDTIQFGNSFLLSSTSSNKSDIFLSKLNTTTGIIELNKNKEFKIFPNPVTSHFTINYENISDAFDVTITDVSGKLIFKRINVQIENLEFNTTDFLDGVYVIRIQNSQLIESKRLIVIK